MASIQFSGMASGMDTAAIVDALMDVESIPKTLLQNQIKDKNTVVGSLQGLNSLVQNLGKTAGEFTSTSVLSQAKTIDAFTTSSSNEQVSVTARNGAVPASLDVRVDQTATSHQMVTAAMTESPVYPPEFTITAGGETTTFTAESGSMQDVVKAINSSGAPVQAALVSAGVDELDQPTYRIQLTSTIEGADGAFEFRAGGIDMAAEPGAAIIQTGRDAEVTLYAGTAAEQTVTSSSNTFTDLLPGVDVTLAPGATGTASVSVAADTDASAKIVKGFIDDVADIIGRISTGSKSTVAEGKNTTLGVFTGDSTVRGVKQALTDAIISPVDGASPFEIGISIDRYGAITFDEEKFAQAMTEDPAATGAFFTQIAGRVGDVSEMYSDRYDGVLTNRIESQQAATRGLEDQVARMDARLEKRRATLELQFLNMERAISGFNSQASYLTSQIASLPTWSNAPAGKS